MWVCEATPSAPGPSLNRFPLWRHMVSKSPSNPLFAAGALLALTVAAVTAQTQFPHAAGTDTTGRAQAVSDAAGRVLIESPEFPRGLWVDLADEAGQALPGIQVEYQGRPDSLVVIWSVDPSGQRQETLLWAHPRSSNPRKRPVGDALHLTLKAADPGRLPAGLASIDWRIGPEGEYLLMLDPVEGPLLTGWGDLTAFLQERWQGRTGRVAVQVKPDRGAAHPDRTALAVDLAHPEPVEKLVDYLQDQSRTSLGEVRASVVQVLLSPYALYENLALLKGSIALTAYVVLVPGSELEQWVLRSLSRSSGPVTLSEAATLTRFIAANRDIVDVGPLVALIGLEELWLQRNEIVDVGPLASLTRLEHLELADNEIVDVSPLAALTSLEELELGYNDIVDVGPLASLTRLKELGLQRNEIVDVSPLATLTGLEKLRLSENDIVDVSPLASLTSLKELWPSQNEIVDVGPLAALIGLEELDLSWNDIVDVSPLASLASLERLELQGNPLDLSSLASLTSLRELKLGKKIVDVSPLVGPLAAMTGLERLHLEGNRIEDISPLAALTGLKGLHLGGNRIVDVSPLAALPGLEVLSLGSQYGLDDRPTLDIGSVPSLPGLVWLDLSNNSYSELVSISPLAALTNLETLILSDNYIADLTPLTGLTKLSHLYSEDNGFEDISPLAALTRLEELLLEGNRIVDVGPLAALTNLEWLSLKGNEIQDIGPLVANPGLGEGDWVQLDHNPLSDRAINEQIPALEARGVQVDY